MNFFPAVAYHFSVTLLKAFTQPGARLLAEPCTSRSLLIITTGSLFKVLIGGSVGDEVEIRIGSVAAAAVKLAVLNLLHKRLRAS